MEAYKMIETPIKTIVIEGWGKKEKLFIFILFWILIIAVWICLFRLWGII